MSGILAPLLLSGNRGMISENVGFSSGFNNPDRNVKNGTDYPKLQCLSENYLKLLVFISSRFFFACCSSEYLP